MTVADCIVCSRTISSNSSSVTAEKGRSSIHKPDVGAGGTEDDGPEGGARRARLDGGEEEDDFERGDSGVLAEREDSARRIGLVVAIDIILALTIKSNIRTSLRSSED
jgi:hypothetical protein